MQIERNVLAAAALVKQLQSCRVGVVATGLSVNPAAVTDTAARLLGQHLYVAVVGYEVDSPVDNATIKKDVESAVEWRSTPTLARRIVVFVRDEAPKLHSLSDLDVLTDQDIVVTLIQNAARELAYNQPQQRFWDALEAEAATFPLQLVEEFVRAVEAGRADVNAIPLNLWRLGLLADAKLLQRNQDPVDRLRRNRDLLVEMALLSERSRKRLGSVLAQVAGSDGDRLRSAFLLLQKFYRTRSKNALQKLNIATVEELLRAGRPISRPARLRIPTDNDASGNDRPEQPLRGNRLVSAIAECVVTGTEEAQAGLRELGEALYRRIHEPQESYENVTVDPGFGGRTIHLETAQRELRTFIASVCSLNSWGGLLQTGRTELKEAVLYSNPDDFKPYNPGDPTHGVVGQSLFSLLRSFDLYLPPGGTFGQALNQLTSARERLLDHVDLLLSHPWVIFGGYDDARKALDDYLDAYSTLLHLFRQNEAALHAIDAQAVRYVATEILRLEVIYVKTPSEWKGLLTPLHPFYLWRFREVLRAIHVEHRPLTDKEQSQLASAIPNLPHLIHFLVIGPQLTTTDPVVLPQAGTIELLPTFENRTNRYLGTDGLEFLPNIMERFLAFAPYAYPQLRLAVVDVPDLSIILEMVTEFLHHHQQSRLVLDAYYTRGQNPKNDMGRLDYNDRNHEVSEMLRSGMLVVQFHSFDTCEGVAQALMQKPVHLAFFFDQAHYQVTPAPRARQLLVSPLVITYQYDYSDIFHRGIIAPSSEAEDGLFSDFHFLIERTALLPAGQQLRIQYDPGNQLEPVNTLLETGATRWLVTADRMLTGYAPTEAVPLSEKRFGQREVGVWARASVRAVQQLVDLLHRFNLRPDVNRVTELLQRFGHVAAGGLLSIPAGGSGSPETRDRQQKAYLGTVLAAAWYVRKYPSALVASLDSSLARLWLHARPDGDGQRADLIGLRIREDSGVVIEPIEVKTRASDSDLSIERVRSGSVKLVGRAADQLQSTLTAMRPIFGTETDAQPLFTPARREVLKYQLHRECFKQVHDPQWQKDWYYRLRDIFALPPRSSVECRGLVVHIQLEENTEVQVWDDHEYPLSLVILGSREIQQLVASWSTESGIRSMVEANVGSDPASAVETYSPSTSEYILNSPWPNQVVGGLATATETGKPADLRVPSEVITEPSIQSGTFREGEELSRMFRRACQSFRIQVDECDPSRAIPGPTVWRFYVRLSRGQRLDALRNSLEDIGREMRRSGLLLSTLPNSDEIALDVPRGVREIIPLPRGLRCLPPISSPERMPLAVGVTPEGQDLVRDLADMPHLLVGGTTGSGKTVFLYGLLSALLTRHPEPSTLRLLLSTSKPEDFVFFQGLPHLETGRVITDADEAIQLLETHVGATFDNRLDLLTQARCRDISTYNASNPDSALPPLVVVVDEFADLADQLSTNRVAREAFYKNIRRIAQLGRNRGIHLILCTQRPSADLVPTHIRNLMNARVALRVNDAIASRMILEEVGAEQLQLHGDLLFKDHSGLVRAQGYFIDADGLDNMLSTLRQ